MLTLVAFIVALALLIAVHEYGHYRMAVACGVKVLTFSIGFGKPLWRWQASPETTEFVVALVPLGGYVKMLDEREGPVEVADLPKAFNTQTLVRRSAIVAAGPLANLALAVVLYACVNWMGVQQPAPVLGYPGADTLASQAGLRGTERVTQVGMANGDLMDVQSFEDVRLILTRAALDNEDVRLVLDHAKYTGREVILPLSGLKTSQVDGELFAKIGIVAPYTRPVIGATMDDGIARNAGLLAGDEVLMVNHQGIVDGLQLRQLIRASGSSGKALAQTWQLKRDGQVIELVLTPEVVNQEGVTIGRIGAYVGSPPDMVDVSYGPIDGLWRGFVQTWDMSVLTLSSMGKMVVGELSIKNISGPLTIADYAGKSASLGLSHYLIFLALISVSLGVLNLLPVPILDGGHLMYYLWEGVIGKPVSQRWMERFQQGGIVVLMLLMAVAFFNDITRLFG